MFQWASTIKTGSGRPRQDGPIHTNTYIYDLVHRSSHRAWWALLQLSEKLSKGDSKPLSLTTCACPISVRWSLFHVADSIQWSKYIYMYMYTWIQPAGQNMTWACILCINARIYTGECTLLITLGSWRGRRPKALVWICDILLFLCCYEIYIKFTMKTQLIVYLHFLLYTCICALPWIQFWGSLKVKSSIAIDCLSSSCSMHDVHYTETVKDILKFSRCFVLFHELALLSF